MKRLTLKREQRSIRKNRIRTTVSGTSERPRLSIFVSNTHITAQVIDDEKGHTLAYSTSVGAKEAGKSMTDKAAWVGADIADKAKKAKVSKVAFDRGGKLYHGRVKALADAARSAGLEF